MCSSVGGHAIVTVSPDLHLFHSTRNKGVFFFTHISLSVVVSYHFKDGELSNTQKQAVITLIEKKGKDRRLIKKLETDIPPKRRR